MVNLYDQFNWIEKHLKNPLSVRCICENVSARVCPNMIGRWYSKLIEETILNSMISSSRMRPSEEAGSPLTKAFWVPPFSLIPGNTEHSSFPLLHPLPWCFCLTTILKAMEPTDHAPKPLKSQGRKSCPPSS